MKDELNLGVLSVNGGRSNESLCTAMNETDCTSEEQVVTANAVCLPQKIHPYLKFLRSFFQEATPRRAESPERQSLFGRHRSGETHHTSEEQSVTPTHSV